MIKKFNNFNNNKKIKNKNCKLNNFNFNKNCKIEKINKIKNNNYQRKD